MNRIKLGNLIRTYLKTYVILLLSFITLITLVCSLPNKNIKDNINKSIPILESEGDYPRIGGDSVTNQLSNFADSIMLNIIYNIDNTSPVEAGLRNEIYRITGPYFYNLRIFSLKAIVEDGEKPNSQYPRYWHGYMVVFRPLLLITSYSGIRQIYQIVSFILLSLLISLLYKRFSIVVASIFSFSLAIINYLIIPLSIQFANVFFISFIATIFLLLSPHRKFDKLLIIYFIVGAFTSFIDLLTAPIITFGIPAVILIIYQGNDRNIKEFFINVILLISYFFSWALGYGMLWGSKWVVASLILRENIIIDGIGQVVLRAGGEIPSSVEKGRPLIIAALISNVFKIISIPRTLLILIPIILLVGIFILWRKVINELLLSSKLLLLSTIPYFWIIFTSNHSYGHSWFTYRIQVVTIISVLCAYYYAINWECFYFDIRRFFEPIKR